jgi:hypothetical protein
MLGRSWPDLGQVEPRREVVPVSEEHADAHVLVLAEPLVGRHELGDRGEVEGVALVAVS